MKAIFITQKGNVEVLQLRDTSISDPKSDEIQIQVKAFGLNFADILARQGMYPDAPTFPFIPGYEASGLVSKVGSQVQNFKEGDSVMALSSFGAYAEYCNVSAGAARKLPSQLNFTQAAALPVNALTAYIALLERGNLKKGQRILIQAAAGGVGLCAVQMAKHIGAEIFGTAGSDPKCQFLKEIGVAHPINYRTQDYEAEIMRVTQGKGVEIVLDSLGGEHLKKGLRILQANGKLCAIGIAGMLQEGKKSYLKMLFEFSKTPFISPYKLMMADKAFMGINLKRLSEQRPEVIASAFEGVMQWVEQGQLKPILAKTFTLNKIQEAHEYLQGRNAIGKVVVEIN